MRIGLVSDTHNEFYRCDDKHIPDVFLHKNIDVLVLAGDIDTEANGARWAVEQGQRLGLPVIYLVGNHELYSESKTVQQIKAEIEEVTAGNSVHYSEHLSVVIDDVKFISATLWTDFSLLGGGKAAACMSKGLTTMSDFDSIREKPNMFIIPNTMIKWHNQAKAFIESELAEPFDGKTVVVTHHAPSAQCLPEGWDRTDSSSQVSSMYSSNLDSLIKKYKPEAWMHGHIHSPKIHRIGQTVVLSNPRGYPSQVDGPKGWCKVKVLEV